MNALADALRAQARALELVAAALDAQPDPSRPSYYDRTHLPPAASSWRAARETAAREGIAVVRTGRSVVIPAPAWDAHLAARTSHRGPSPIASSDVARLASMGLTLQAAR